LVVDTVSTGTTEDSRRTGRSARTVVFWTTARRAVRSGVVWGYFIGIAVASSAISYTRIYTTQGERDALAKAFGSNNATAALFGPAPELQTVAGFTVFKSLMTVMVLGALWGLLTSTRLLRGEEDAGRWELLLTGQSTKRAAAAQGLGGLGMGLAALWFVTAVITVLIGRISSVGFSVDASLYFSLAQVAAALMFLAVGALTSQLAATRRQAMTLGGWFLGFCYFVRMVADAGVGLRGLIWASPLGWVEQLQPLTSPDPLALLPIAGFTAGIAAVTLHFSGRRDVGGSLLRDHTHAQPHLRLLSGHWALSIRLLRPVVVGWVVALAATGLALGLIAKQAGGTVSGSSVEQVFARLGAPGTSAQSFLGVCFLIVAILTGFMAAGQTTAARTEEAEGRTDDVVIQPVSRTAWLGGRVVIAVVVLVLGGLVAGFCSWVGVAVEGGGVSFTTLLKAGINVVPAAICLLGIGILALGVLPRVTSYVVYGYLGWSLLIELVGGFGSGSRWLLDTSLYHQMAAAPAVDPNWAVNGVMIGIGAVAALVGSASFRRRDLLAA
jgi:polyether ionophore transport system permease protein